MTPAVSQANYRSGAASAFTRTWCSTSIRQTDAARNWNGSLQWWASVLHLSICTFVLVLHICCPLGNKSYLTCGTLTVARNIYCFVLDLQTPWYVIPLHSSFDRRETASHGESERQFKKASSCNYCLNTQLLSPAGIRQTGHTHTQKLFTVKWTPSLWSTHRKKSFTSSWNDKHPPKNQTHTQTHRTLSMNTGLYESSSAKASG